MKKIPTLFERTDDRRHVINRVHPGCEWVLNGEGVATRKYDGTCTRKTSDGQWWTRREIKPGGETPPGFVLEDYDEVTGKTVGWEPAEQSGFWKFIQEAIDGDEEPGTYELCGPKINGNPEHLTRHELIAHGAEVYPQAPRDFEGLREWLAQYDIEGIVWHHPDGRMVKLKNRDFPKGSA